MHVGLESLPAELLDIILDHCETLTDQNALVSTSRTLHRRSNSQLYKINLDWQKGSALLWAAQRGSIETLEVIFALGWDLNRIFEVEIPPGGGFIITSRADHEAWHMPSPRYGSPNPRRTALVEAVRYGHEEVVSWLLDHGADANTECELSYRDRNRDPLMSVMTLVKRQKDCPVCKAMGVFNKLTCRAPYTAITTALYFRHESIAIDLLARGATWSRFPSRRCHSSPLLCAIQLGLFAVVDFLASQPGFKDDLKVVDHSGWGPMHYACQCLRSSGGPSSSMVAKLIALGADTDSRDWELPGHTPMMRAVAAANHDAVLQLLRCGAHPVPMPGGLNLLHLCCLPPSRPCPPSPGGDRYSYASALSSREALFKDLVASGYGINERVSHDGVFRGSKWFRGDTPLHLVARHQTSLDLFKTLLREGGSPKLRNSRGRCPLEVCYALEGVPGLHRPAGYLVTLLGLEAGPGVGDRTGWRRAAKSWWAGFSENQRREELLYRIIDAEAASAGGCSYRWQREYVDMVLREPRRSTRVFDA